MTAKAPSDFTISVPASIANLGPGFDTLAVAVQLYLRITVRAGEGRNQLQFRFAGGPIDGENYIERAFLFAATQSGRDFPALEIDVRSDIPARAGLGSSAAATVAGLRLYEAIAGPLSPQGLLNAASALEHHPDNVAAALLGGLTVSCQLSDRSVVAVRLDWPEELGFIVLTPGFALPTRDSRLVLPDKVLREDAIFNLQRTALLLQAVATGNFALLREALEDRIHQPYRQKIVPGLEQALALQHPDLLGVCLSGAGPSIVALAAKNFSAIENLLANSFAATGLPFRIRRLRAHEGGSGYSSEGSCHFRLP